MDEANVLILLANLGVLALNLKLYTEYFKNEAQNGRRKGTSDG
jgi:hypothetical protein